MKATAYNRTHSYTYMYVWESEHIDTHPHTHTHASTHTEARRDNFIERHILRFALSALLCYAGLYPNMSSEYG